MAAPTIEKTWQFLLNQTIGASTAGQERRELMLAIKNALKAFASNPWTVVGSCGGEAGTTAAAMDGVDRWAAQDDLLWATSGDRAWIVLKQTGLLANFQLLIWLSGAAASSANKIFVAFSKSAGFTGGTTSTRPTATDEVVINNSGDWQGSTSTGGFRFHVLQSSDGQCTRVLIGRGGFTTGFWLLDKPKNPKAAWPSADRVVAHVAGGSSSTADYITHANFHGAAALHARVNSITAAYFMTCEGCNDDALGQLQTTPDDLDGSYPALPIGLYSSTIGNVGRHGQIYDLWFGSVTPANGDAYPDVAPPALKTYGQAGDLIVPANGLTLAFG